MNAVLSRTFTFIGGAAGTVAVAGVASGYPKWLVITCIAIMGGAAKLSNTPFSYLSKGPTP